MNFWKLFLRVLPYKPAQAVAAAYWQLTRRRLRARNRLRAASADLPFAYAVWIGNNEWSSKLAEDAVDIYRTVLRTYPQRDVASQAKSSLKGLDL